MRSAGPLLKEVTQNQRRVFAVLQPMMRSIVGASPFIHARIDRDRLSIDQAIQVVDREFLTPKARKAWKTLAPQKIGTGASLVLQNREPDQWPTPYGYTAPGIPDHWNRAPRLG